MKDLFIKRMVEVSGEYSEGVDDVLYGFYDGGNWEEVLLGDGGLGKLVDDKFFYLNESDCDIEEKLLVELEDVLDFVCEELDIEVMC